MRTRPPVRLHHRLLPGLLVWLMQVVPIAVAPSGQVRAATGFAAAPDTVLSIGAVEAPIEAAMDPPSIAGRIGLLQGAVQRWDLRENAWRDALLNETVGARGALRTGPDGRAEASVGTTAFRLDRLSEIAWDRMDDDLIALDLERGRLVVSTRREDARPPQGAAWGDDLDIATGRSGAIEPIPIEVRAGEAIVRLPGAGATRIEHDAEHRLVVSVLAGEAVVLHGGNRSPVRLGQMLAVDTRDGAVRSAGAVAPTAFDDWSHDRDRRASARPSYRYVSPTMTGADVLDDHGRWDVSDTWGPVWFPTVVAPGWAPYRDGRWVWTPGWGWTWVDAAPWGFAPFHYGRWVTIGPRWAWVPGRYVRRPVYAPALVGFHGRHDLARAGVAPRAGWFPLGPRDAWRPPYRHTPRYVEAVNRTYRPVDHGRRVPPVAARPLPGRPPQVMPPAPPARTPASAPREWRAPRPDPLLRAGPPAVAPDVRAPRGRPDALVQPRPAPATTRPHPAQVLRRQPPVATPPAVVAPPAVHRRAPPSLDRRPARAPDRSSWRGARPDARLR
ncbi:MAG: DUF6600 domain-containing protein [Lautropia sp.]